MWKYFQLKNERHAIKALDELSIIRSGTVGLKIAVFDLDRGCVVMGLGDSAKVASALALTDKVVKAMRKNAHGKFAVLAYDQERNTVMMLDSTNEFPALCAMMCAITEVVLNHDSCPKFPDSYEANEEFSSEKTMPSSDCDDTMYESLDAFFRV